jgi:transcriptional regulator with XRE-family HTH domain
MPKGIPAYTSERARLEQAMSEIQARLQDVAARDKQMEALREWLSKDGDLLTRTDVARVAKEVISAQHIRHSQRLKAAQPERKTEAKRRSNGLENTTRFGAALRKLRKEKGWTADELAKKLKVNPSTLTTWERGRYSPKPESHALIMRVTGLSESDFDFSPSGSNPGKHQPRGAFGAALFEARQKLGITPDQMGEKLGVSYATVYGWEHSKYKPNASLRPTFLKLTGLPETVFDLE